MLWCMWITPLGRPVLPEVYSQNAGSSRSVCAQAICSSCWLSKEINDRSPSICKMCCKHGDSLDPNRSNHDRSVTNTWARQSWRIYRTSSNVQAVLIGTGTIPSQIAPQKANTNSGVSGNKIAIRCSRSTPSAANNFAIRRTQLCTCA